MNEKLLGSPYFHFHSRSEILYISEREEPDEWIVQSTHDIPPGTDGVTWKYSARKIFDKVYELHLKAIIQDGWHLYAQEQPENFIGSATTIKFNQHPLLVFDGKVKEVGELEKSKEPTLDIESWQYTSEVDFVQRVTLKNNVKATVSGSIEFQVCTDEMCLQPTSINF